GEGAALRLLHVDSALAGAVGVDRGHDDSAHRHRGADGHVVGLDLEDGGVVSGAAVGAAAATTATAAVVVAAAGGGTQEQGQSESDAVFHGTSWGRGNPSGAPIHRAKEKARDVAGLTLGDRAPALRGGAPRAGDLLLRLLAAALLRGLAGLRRRGRRLLLAAGRLRLLGRRLRRALAGAADDLDDRHRGGVPDPGAGLEQAGVAARPPGQRRRDLREQ